MSSWRYLEGHELDSSSAAEDFLSYLSDVKQLSQNTLDSYGRDLRQFMQYLSYSGVLDVSLANSNLISTYLDQLAMNGKAASSISRHLASLKSFFSFLILKAIIEDNPTDSVGTFKVDKRAPEVLSKQDIEKILDVRDITTPVGMRDKAILELLYATGIRASEAISLSVDDVSTQAGYVRCSGAKERVIPLGKPACSWVELYLISGRPQLIQTDRIKAMFVNHHGLGLTRQGFWKIVKKRAEAVGVCCHITPHILRHSFAAHMVAGGADLRAVQEMLGHADISSTQVYAASGRRKLRDVYEDAHPRALR